MRILRFGSMSRDWHFGSLDSRELTIRPIVPFAFLVWTQQHTFSFRWRRLVSPVAWWRWIWQYVLDRNQYELWWRGGEGWTHRCYCDTGSAFDLKLVIAGFGFILFWSNFTGDVPCPCDEVSGHLFGND